MIHPYLHDQGYSIIHTNLVTNVAEEVNFLQNLIDNLPVASFALQQKFNEIRTENNTSKNLALMKRNKAFLQDLPEVSGPDIFTMSVGQWLAYPHNSKLPVHVVGRQGSFVALQTKFK